MRIEILMFEFLYQEVLENNHFIYRIAIEIDINK